MITRLCQKVRQAPPEEVPAWIDYAREYSKTNNIPRQIAEEFRSTSDHPPLVALIAGHAPLSVPTLKELWADKPIREVFNNTSLNDELLDWIETRGRKAVQQDRGSSEHLLGRAWLYGYMRAGFCLSASTHDVLMEACHDLQHREGLLMLDDPPQAFKELADILLYDTNLSAEHLEQLADMDYVVRHRYLGRLLMTHEHTTTKLAISICREYDQREQWPIWLTEAILRGRKTRNDQALLQYLLEEGAGEKNLFRKLIDEQRIPEDDYPQALHRLMEKSPKTVLDLIQQQPDLVPRIRSDTLSQLLSHTDEHIRQQATRLLQHRTDLSGKPRQTPGR